MRIDELLIDLLARGPATRAELQAAVGGSQPTLARALGRLSVRIARLGRGRSTRYALRRPIRDLTDIPVYRVDTGGRIHNIGHLAPIQPDGLWYEASDNIRNPRGRNELFPGLPWFLADMRPQGFLGRLFARRCQDRDLPERLSDWNDNHVLYALATLGEDQPGNLVLGEESHQRWQGLRREGSHVFSNANRITQFRERAAQVLAGESPGSSAGGEQQKFAVAIQSEQGETRHFIVKFSALYRERLGRRWADLLIWEHLAKQTLREVGISAAETELFDDGERLYLQIARFDRVGVYGRRGVVSLGSLDDAFVGQRRTWSATAEALSRLGWMTREDAIRTAWLEGFGRLIANTDMHFGNLSVLHEGERPLALSPAYDMLPMTYAPRVTGEISEETLDPPALPPQSQPQAVEIVNAAIRFWRAAAEDVRVSPNGREIALRNVAAVSRLVQQ